MKPLLSLLFLLCPLAAGAQGSVTVYQGTDIDNVLNSKRKKAEPAAPAPEQKAPTTPASEKPHAEEEAETAHHATQTKLVQKRVLVPIDDAAKLDKGAGFRIQVYSGGNTREARQEAERAGHKVKAAFPDMPVYVHFYTPRWGCRVGNFRTYQEARKIMKKIWKLGYRQAIILRKPGQLGEKKKQTATAKK